jgi:SRSO17 transposase
MSSLLDHPQAKALLEETTVPPALIQSCAEDLHGFLQRYLPCFYREEQRGHAHTILQGKLRNLERKTTEPIARLAGQKRRPLQHFVGAGRWQDAAVLGELQRHVSEAIGEPQGVLTVDGHGVAKWGNGSCGVARQWCGRLGKVENCQVGVFLGYVSARGKALLDCRLYLTEDRADDAAHRTVTVVPAAVVFEEKWRLALELIRTSGQQVPHGWVTGDDEFGRVSDLRGQLRLERERYVLDVPCNTLVRDPAERRPPSRPGGSPRLPVFERADAWAARQPKGRWRKIRIRAGEKGWLEVQALQQRLQTKEEGGHVGPRERLVILRSCAKKPQTWYTLSNAAKEVALVEVVKAHAKHHGVEELFQEGVQEVGLNHYEVRSWVGWHHHMTLTFLALWFLEWQRLRLRKKNPRYDGVPGGSDRGGAAGAAVSRRGEDRPEGE